ncbi:substrate-binding domain-containing protein, partial [Acinetobacter baumannii]
MALGVLFEAQHRGLAVPRQLAVTGFGNLPYSQVCVPPLTTVQPHAAEIGLRVAQELLAQLQRDEAPEQEEDSDDGATKVVDVGFE